MMLSARTTRLSRACAVLLTSSLGGGSDVGGRDVGNRDGGNEGRGDRGSASALRALHMATLGGATALGLNALVGSIEVGKFADLTCIDLSALAAQPAARRPADAIVFSATRDQVTDVWTSGRAAVSDGHLLTFDEQELLALTRRWADRIPTGGAS